VSDVVTVVDITDADFNYFVIVETIGSKRSYTLPNMMMMMMMS